MPSWKWKNHPLYYPHNSLVPCIWETISFMITTSTIILGNSWYQQHDPVIFWKSGEIQKWSNYCHDNCLHRLHLCFNSTTVESPETHIKVDIPLHPFSKTKATGLSPYFSYNCIIELLYYQGQNLSTIIGWTKVVFGQICDRIHWEYKVMSPMYPD